MWGIGDSLSLDCSIQDSITASHETDISFTVTWIEEGVETVGKRGDLLCCSTEKNEMFHTGACYCVYNVSRRNKETIWIQSMVVCIKGLQ